MDKLKLQMVALTALFVGMFMLTSPVKRVLADTGHEGATRVENGSYAETYIVTVDSTSGTALWSDSTSRPQGLCKVFGSNVVMIGTTSASNFTGVHENIRIGFPLAGSDTIKTGSYTGSLYGTSQSGVASAELRCLNGRVRTGR